jgi:hypothetical protein
MDRSTDRKNSEKTSPHKIILGLGAYGYDWSPIRMITLP